jgi:hypothetical protein
MASVWQPAMWEEHDVVHRRTRRNRVGYRMAGIGAIVVAVASALYLIVVSPVLLAAAADQGDDWAYMADVGTAYGGVSAILSGLALCGVAASLILQRRQAAADRIIANRERHFDLASLALNDPALQAATDPRLADRPHAREEIYINMMLGFWRATWLIGEMDDHGLRVLVGTMFEGPIAREWWSHVRHQWNTYGSSRRTRRFRVLIDDEWRKACATAQEPSPA